MPKQSMNALFSLQKIILQNCLPYEETIKENATKMEEKHIIWVCQKIS